MSNNTVMQVLLTVHLTIMLRHAGWGIYVRVDDDWSEQDEIKICSLHCRNPERVKFAHFRASAHPAAVGTTSEQGWPGLFSQWLRNEDCLSSCGKYVGIKLEVHRET